MIEFDFVNYILLPVLIFLARVADVTLATVKLMFVVNNARKIAAVLGFFEALITIVALSRIVQDASNLVAYTMYAAGFATGTYIGMRIEEKLAYGSVVVRIIGKRIPDALLEHLAENEYRYSMVDANDQSGNTQVLLTMCQRKELTKLLKNLEHIAPQALYTIEGVKQLSRELVPNKKPVTAPRLPKWCTGLSKRTQAAFHLW